MAAPIVMISAVLFFTAVIAFFPATIVLSAEINYNIKGVHPRYSTLDLKPVWKLDNLIQALYFSIFYMKPG